jgi:lysophospholipase L1-like esterase
MALRTLPIKAALLVLGILLGLTASELALRAHARLAGKERTLQYDDFLGWKLRPGAKRLFGDESQPFLIEINSRGLRDVEHTLEKPAGVYRIVFLGDSFLFGAGGVATQDRFAEILARSFRNVEVINLGVPGYSTDQEYLSLQQEGLQYHPDLVVMCLFDNDFEESFVSWNPSIGRPKSYFTRHGSELEFHPPQTTLFYRVAERSYVLALAERLWARVRRKSQIQQSKSMFTPPERIVVFRMFLQKVGDLAASAHSGFVALYIPFQQQTRKNKIQDILGDLARTDGLKILDLMDDLKRADSEKPAYFHNDVHLNESGNQRVAQALQQYLTANHLLPSN